MLLVAECHKTAASGLLDSSELVADDSHRLLASLLRFGTTRTRAVVTAALPTDDRASYAVELLRRRFADVADEGLVGAAPAPSTEAAQLQLLLVELRKQITRESTPPDLSDEMRLYYFASLLRSRSLNERPRLATADTFRLFAEILLLTPPAALVDAICATIDAALRQPAGTTRYGKGLGPEQINTTYAAQVCSPAMANALCNLVARGPDFASRAVFGALRYCIESAEFKSLSTRDSLWPINQWEADETRVIRRAAQRLRTQHLLPVYSALPFPKPDFPFTEDSLSALSYAVWLSLRCRFLPTRRGYF
jgi:hypothetical protein